jgi:hypothetical protein
LEPVTVSSGRAASGSAKATRAPPELRFSAQIRPPVGLDERDRQAEAGAARRAGARRVVPPEALEHTLRRAPREPATRVLDRDDHVVAVRLDDHGDGAVAGRVPDRS